MKSPRRNDRHAEGMSHVGTGMVFEPPGRMHVALLVLHFLACSPSKQEREESCRLQDEEEAYWAEWVEDTASPTQDECATECVGFDDVTRCEVLGKADGQVTIRCCGFVGYY
jgi:hypothetical protein